MIRAPGTLPPSLLLRNCRLFDAPPAAPPVELWVSDGSIAAVGAVPDLPPDVPVLDAGGRTLIPGLIDLHIHGAGGADVRDGTPDALRTMSVALARMGTTSFVGTTPTQPHLQDRHLEAAAPLVGAALGGARLLGLYLEGPFANTEKRGGLPAASLYPPATGALERILELCRGTLRVMTVAPELPGALGVIERLAAAGVVPAFGHSNASYEQTRDGIAAGIRHVTHLFNAMAPLHHRAPGPLPALLDAEHVTVELIADDVHLSRQVTRFAARIFGPERCACITDAMPPAGLPDGRYRFAGLECEARDGVARYPDGTLIGTAIPLLEIVRRFQTYTGASFARAVHSATRVPARILGIEHRTGSIESGKDADLVLLDPDGTVWATLVAGEVVYRK